MVKDKEKGVRFETHKRLREKTSGKAERLVNSMEIVKD